MSETDYEFKALGILQVDGKEIPVVSLGKPDPVNYFGFDILKKAQIVSAKKNKIDIITEKGRKDRFFLGESSDALFLSKFQTNTNIEGCNILNNYKTEENPFSDLAGCQITKVMKDYLSPADKTKDLPWEVILEGSNGVGYQIVGDDEEIIVYKNDASTMLVQKFGRKFLFG